MVTSLSSSGPASATASVCKSNKDTENKIKNYNNSSGQSSDNNQQGRNSDLSSNGFVNPSLRPSAFLFNSLGNSSFLYRNSSANHHLASPPPKKGFVEKMFGRRKSVTLNGSDPVYKTVYLGNVITALPKGEGCLKKPLEAIWKHYKTTKQPPAEMTLTVTNAGLKARTAEQGVIQYKANRLTHCAAPLDYPRLFAWIYKHDAKNMKYESRCHAVLCHDEFKARELATALESRLQFVFAEWLRQKRSRSQILDRLKSPELAAALPAIPARKQMLSAGQKYKPQEAKARSLSSIREAVNEDPPSEGDDDDDRNLALFLDGQLCLDNDRGYSYSGESSSTPPAIFEDIEGEEVEELDEREDIVNQLPESSPLNNTEIIDCNNNTSNYDNKNSPDESPKRSLRSTSSTPLENTSSSGEDENHLHQLGPYFQDPASMPNSSNGHHSLGKHLNFASVR